MLIFYRCLLACRVCRFYSLSSSIVSERYACKIICRCGLCVNADPVLMGLDGDGHNAINWAPPARPAGFSVAGHISLCYKFVNFC